MRKNIIVVLTLTLALPTACIAPKHTVTKVSAIPRSGAPSGIYYSLPLTVVTAKIPITKTTLTPGPFICYAEALGLDIPKELTSAAQTALELQPDVQSLDEDTRRQFLMAAVVENSLYDHEKNAVDALKAAINAKAPDVEQRKKEVSALATVERIRELLEHEDIWLMFFVRTKGAECRRNTGSFFNTSTTYRLGAPEVAATGRPDPDNVYRVDIQSSYAQTRELIVELSEMGLMTVGDSAAADKTLDYYVAATKAVSRYGAAFAPAAGRAGLDVSSDAQAIADAIEKLRGQRLELVTGRAPSLTSLAAPALERMLSEIGKEEEKLLANFWTKATSAANIVVDLTPTKVCEHDLFYFSSKTGIKATGEKTPTHMRIIIPDGFGSATQAEDTVVLQLEVLANQPASDAKNDSKALGFRYRIPALGRVSIVQKPYGTTAQKRLGEQELLIAQLGAVVALPAGVSSVNSQFRAELFEQSGALKKATVKSTAVDPALIDKIGDAVENLGKAEAARRAAAAARGSRFKRATDKLAEFQGLVKSLGGMGLPVPAWAIEAVTEDPDETDETNCEEQE